MKISVVLLLSLLVITSCARDNGFSLKHKHRENIKNIYSFSYIREDQTINGNISGGFFLGCGEIKGSLETSSKINYYFYVIDEYGGKVLNHCNAENVSVIETDSISPRFVFEEDWTDKTWRTEPERGPSTILINYKSVFKLYVPKNTIILKKFKL